MQKCANVKEGGASQSKLIETHSLTGTALRTAD